jgi:acetyl-CoA carboxylase alpha subunit
VIDCYSVYSGDRNLPATQTSVLGHTAVTGDIAQHPMNLDVHFGQSLPQVLRAALRLMPRDHRLIEQIRILLENDGAKCGCCSLWLSCRFSWTNV